MPYTEAVIRETLRIDPINPLSISRRCLQDTYLRGYFIPKVLLFLMHFQFTKIIIFIVLTGYSYFAKFMECMS